MNVNDPIRLKHCFHLSEIADRIASGKERISVREVSSTVTRHCPNCGVPIVHHLHDTHWYDCKTDERALEAKLEASGKHIYTDGDTIFIQEVYDSFCDHTYKFLDLDAQLIVGGCPFCGEDFGLVEVMCFSHIPHPEEGAAGDPGNCVLCDFRFEHMLRSIEENKLCVVCLGEDEIGAMHYGKNIVFRADAFGGYPTEDFTSDCCAFCLDCVYTESRLDASPIGVTCGHFDMNDTENDWNAAAVIAMALYQAGKEYMAQARQ